MQTVSRLPQKFKEIKWLYKDVDAVAFHEVAKRVIHRSRITTLIFLSPKKKQQEQVFKKIISM
jgi:KaiC/GvpD/RAD55 family RecA-like ATPase